MREKKTRAPWNQKASKILFAAALVGIWCTLIYFDAHYIPRPQIVYGATIVNEETETETETEPAYTEEELYLLSHLICGEVEGCDRQMKTYVGSVVLNRVADSRFPDNLHDVIYQNNPLQYSCTVDGNFEKEPGEETIEVTKYLLENGSQLPPNVIFQAEFVQGTGTYGEPLLAPNGVEMYFCTG